MADKKEYKDFESAMARLEEIVASLESGDLSLEQSLALYSEGVGIADICNKRLAEADGKIAKLSKLADRFKLDKLAENEDE
jgi:exodeoxyribonuclease VII small subunit